MHRIGGKEILFKPRYGRFHFDTRYIRRIPMAATFQDYGRYCDDYQSFHNAN
jgi:hypothetical protein